MATIRTIRVSAGETLNTGDFKSVRGDISVEVDLACSDLTNKGTGISKPALKQINATVDKILYEELNRRVALQKQRERRS
mgnify:CR=1 FL=1|tara:strand:+ start:782 stop:1021 length:240 start_codon:yes stop_codon:yes gene_type:complete